MLNIQENYWHIIVLRLLTGPLKLSQQEMETFREDLAALGFRFQFITLAGFHALNYSMFELAKSIS